MNDIPGLAARRAALKMCDAVLRRGETLDQASGAALQHISSGPDRALAHAMAAESLRWLNDLDVLMDKAMRKPLPDDAKARAVLRLMLAQWLRLATPPHAVIATALPLLAGGPRRLAHGVFSTLVKQGAQLPAVPSLPDAVVARWGAGAQNIAAGLAVPPPLDLVLRDANETTRWLNELGGTSLMPGHIRLARGERVENLPGFADGAWWVQDLAASLPARLLGMGEGHGGEGRRVLDLCAAPGGKSLQLAAAGWRVSALDISARRLSRLRDNFARTGLEAEHIIVADALKWAPDEPYDAVLLDAPCTATGTCRRHPDVLHRIGPRQIEEMAQLQQKLLMRAAQWVRPGGRLVYAVCSLEKEEGADVAQGCALAPDPIHTDELPAGLNPDASGWLQTDPSQLVEAGGLDGFFIARFRA